MPENVRDGAARHITRATTSNRGVRALTARPRKAMSTHPVPTHPWTARAYDIRQKVENFAPPYLVGVLILPVALLLGLVVYRFKSYRFAQWNVCSTTSEKVPQPEAEELVVSRRALGPLLAGALSSPRSSAAELLSQDSAAETVEAPLVPPIKTVAVIGGGAFGTAFAQLMARLGFKVRWYVRNEQVRQSINEQRINSAHMSDVPILPEVTAFGDITETLEGVQLVLMAIPTPALRTVFRKYRNDFPTSVPIILLSKGIENDTLQTPIDIAREELPAEYSQWICAICGPSFAVDILGNKPTYVTLATEDRELGAQLQAQLRDQSFGMYTTTDTIGVEYGGALKNVIAIASGMSNGLNLGKSAQAGVITRGLSEMSEIVVAKGGNPLTMLGLSGVGDLLLTSMSDTSRNYNVGMRLGQGETMAQIRASMAEVAEGVNTAKSVHLLAKKLGLNVPVCEMVYQVTWQNADAKEAFQQLQSGPLGEETKPLCSLITQTQGTEVPYC